MPYVWLCLLIAQLLLLLPIRWKMSLHCREGSTLSAHENACVYFAFPASFFRPFKVYTNFDSSSVPINHGFAATLAYVNRELTNTLVSLVSPRGPYGREEEHAMRYYSGGSFRTGLDVATGIKCEYKCARISRLYLASDSGRTPPNRSPLRLRIFAPKSLVIATLCDLEFFAPWCLRSLQP